MAFNYRKLQGKIVEKLETQSAFAKAMGLSERTISLKLNNKIRFTQGEIFKACDILGIDYGDIGVYFFTPMVQ